MDSPSRKQPALRVSPEVRWENQFAELVRFKREHNHTNVPASGTTSELGGWLAAQRRAALDGELDRVKLRRLEELGVDWTPEETAWEEMLAKLREFKKEHRHCRVPAGWPRNPELAEWVGEQLRVQQAGELRKDRELKLGRAGLLASESIRQPTAERPDNQARWEKQMAEVVAFKERFGHTRVPAKWKENKPLGHWVHIQRAFRRKGMISAERIARLDAIGFEWEAANRLGATREESWDKQWEKMYDQLREFQERFGHCKVLTAWPENPLLSKWVQRQRGHNKAGELRADRKERLEELGFTWHTENAYREERWETQFAALLAYKERFGHTCVPAKWKVNKRLGHWVHIQREFRRKGIISAERIARLDAIGFTWADPKLQGATRQEDWQKRWERKLELLRQFKERFGHCRVPHGMPEFQSLAYWVEDQRDLHRRERLDPARQERLDALGFPWEPEPGPRRKTRRETHEQKWELRFNELVTFKERFGHTRVPSIWEENRPLGNWVDAQRQFRRSGILRADRIERLDALGFEWNRAPSPIQPAPRSAAKNEQAWEQRFAELAAFRQEHGHLRVPAETALGRWLVAQRQAGCQDSPDEEKTRRLAELGVDFRPLDTAWESGFERLRKFCQEHGHLRIPERHPEHGDLAKWLFRQGNLHRRGGLRKDRLQRLEALGWKPLLKPGENRNARYEQRFSELLAFKERFGHFDVPATWKENPALGAWVVVHRQHQHQGRLDPARQKRLEAIGFNWHSGEGSLHDRWNQFFNALVEFKKRTGHQRVPADKGKHPGLYAWVRRQSEMRHLGKLALDRIARLEAMGFEWRAADASAM